MVQELQERRESLGFLEIGVFQDFLVGMEGLDLRVIVEKKDFQVSMEELDQRVITEIQALLVSPSITMEVM